MTGRLAAAVRIVSGLTLVSRFAGLARDVIIMRLLGDSALGSAFRAAYMVPNVFRRLFGEGALSAAFLPHYAQLRKQEPERARALGSIIVWGSTLLTSGLTAAIVLVLALRVLLLPASADVALSIKLVIVLLPIMPMVCLVAVLGGMLQAHGRFGVPAAAPIVLNLFQIGAGAALWLGVLRPLGSAEDELGMRTGVFVIAGAALLASMASVAWSWASLRKLTPLGSARGALSMLRAGGEAKGDARVVWRRFLPAMLGLGTLQLNTMLDTLIAMWPTWVGPTMLGRPTPLDSASYVILSATQTLYQFPLGVFGIAVATAVFPMLARTRDEPGAFIDVLRRGLRLSLFIGLPASAGLMLVRHDLVRVIYGSGSQSFSEDGLVRCAAVLLGFAPAVWAYSLNHVLTRAFYALGDTTTPMRVALGAVALNLGLNLSLIWPMREAGLAWATAMSAMVQCGVLGMLLRRRLHGLREGHERVLNRETVAAFARIGVLALVMAGAVWGVQWLLGPRDTWLGHATRVAACVLGGATAYGGGALLLRAPEARWLLTKGPKRTGSEGESIAMDG
jgi:putative peptidoglycan lipid II flippase